MFGGADFGAGFWDLVAGGAERGERPREVIDHSIGPVWEANHVWLIFCFVVLWTGVLRGLRVDHPDAVRPADARRVRHRAARLELRLPQDGVPHPRPAQLRRRLRPLVGARAVLHRRDRRRRSPPAGCPAGGRAGDPWTSWINPTSILGGVLAVVVVAYLAAVYLVWDARRLDDDAMVAYFRRRAIGAAVVAGVVVARRHLRAARRRPLPLRRADVASAPARDRRPPCAARRRSSCWSAAPRRGARLLAVGAVAAVVVGWGVAQWPYLLPDEPRGVRRGGAVGARSSRCSSPRSARWSSSLPGFILLYVLDQRSLLPGEGVDT